VQNAAAIYKKVRHVGREERYYYLRNGDQGCGGGFLGNLGVCFSG